MPPFSDDIILQLQKFTHEAWRNSRSMLFTHPDLGIEYIDLGEYFEAFQSLFPTAIMFYDKILVRQEYRDALQALKGDRMYYRGAYVTGHPGIGKTLLLIYMLIMSLKEQRRVVLQFPDGRAFYALFQETGFSIHTLNDGIRPIGKLSSSDFMWALSDSNYETDRPSSIFLSKPYQIRVIQATSPEESRWKRWSTEAGVSCYIMDLWTAEETENLAKLLNVDATRMAYLGEKWGYNPRNLLGFIRNSQTDLQIERIYENEAPVAVARTKDIILSITDAPSNFYFCQPMSSSGSSIDRTISRVIVPTDTICRILGRALQHHDNNIRLSFFRALSQHEETRSSAGYIYEHLFHGYFAAGKPLQCQWLLEGHSSDIQLPDRCDVAPSTMRGLTRKAPFFWVAPKNTPGIDSVLVLNGSVHVFQVTISNTHISPINGMKKVRQYLPPSLKDITWKVIFVGQASSVITSVAYNWLNKLFFPTSRTNVPVAWAEVDPVVKGIHYMDFHGEQDSDEEVEPVAQESSLKGKKRSIEEVAKPDEAPRVRTVSQGTKKKT